MLCMRWCVIWVRVRDSRRTESMSMESRWGRVASWPSWPREVCGCVSQQLSGLSEWGPGDMEAEYLRD